VGTKVRRMPWAGREYGRVITNKNKILHTYEGGDGVKTGFTKAAGRCLVSSATRNGMQVVSVVLNCGPMFDECSRLMSLAFSEYHMETILPEYNHLGEVNVQGSKTTSVKVYSQAARQYPLKDGELHGIFHKVDVPSVLTAPVSRNTPVGKVKIYMHNSLLFSENIYTMEDIRPLTLRDYIDDIVSKWSGSKTNAESKGGTDENSDQQISRGLRGGEPARVG